MGKTAILGLGYQVGHTKFQNTIEVQSKLQLGVQIQMSLEEADDVVNYYRRRYWKISNMWQRLNSVGMAALAHGVNKFELGPCKFEKQAILLPNGLRLHYNNLRYVRNDALDTYSRGEWTFDYGLERKKLYGGKILENTTQALARIHTMDAGLRIQKRLPLAMQLHDELVYVVPDAMVDEAKALLHEVMCKPPDWAPDLPLAADVGVGQSYGDAK
jgi:hypothetical protein